MMGCDKFMPRHFFRYSVFALAIQTPFCISFYWQWIHGQHFSQWMFNFYIPAAYLLGLVLRPFVGEGENAAICVVIFSPAIGSVFYSLILGALAFAAHRIGVKRRAGKEV